MRKWIPIALAVLVVILAAGFFGGKAWLARSVMPYDGAVALPGLSAPVEVTIDSLGVPQIWAANDGDLYQTLGWLTARTASGTTYEISTPNGSPAKSAGGEANGPRKSKQKKIRTTRRLTKQWRRTRRQISP